MWQGDDLDGPHSVSWAEVLVLMLQDKYHKRRLAVKRAEAAARAAATHTVCSLSTEVES